MHLSLLVIVSMRQMILLHASRHVHEFYAKDDIISFLSWLHIFNLILGTLDSCVHFVIIILKSQ